jgi:hypothetical protein
MVSKRQEMILYQSALEKLCVIGGFLVKETLRTSLVGHVRLTPVRSAFYVPLEQIERLGLRCMALGVTR